MRSRRGAMQMRPYPTPATDRCDDLMLAVIKSLGELPTDDDGIEDRVLACLMVAWGEVAAMESDERRAEILQSLTPIGNRVVAKLRSLAQPGQAEAGESPEI